MNLESFTTLIEIQSLDKYIGNHQKVIESEKNRIVALEKERNDKEHSLKEKKEILKDKKEKLLHHENTLSDLQNKLAKSTENMTFAKSEQQVKAIEKEQATLHPLIEEHEGAVLELMENVELLEEEINNIEQFLTGSLTSLKSIKEEVDQIVEKENKEINNYNERIETLKNNCEKGVIEIFENINQKYRFNNPLSFIENHSCNQCRFSINRMLESQLEKGTLLEQCPGCGRIFTPHAARV